MTTAGPITLSPVRIAMDVSDLDASTTFYRDILGFNLVSSDRPGLIYETRLTRSDRFPALELELRAGFGKRIGGSGPGGVLRFGFQVPDLNAAVAQLTGKVRWIGEPPAADATAVRFADPDGYVIELRVPTSA